MVMVMVVVGMQVQAVLVMMVLMMGIVGLNCVMWMDWRMGIPFI